MVISRSQMGSQLTGNRVSTGDDARDLDIIRFGKGGKTEESKSTRRVTTLSPRNVSVCLTE
jgi:hypothetical protein